MPAQIRPSRLDVTDRFPMLSFIVRSSAAGRAEIALATDPALFKAAAAGQRNGSNFHSSRLSADLRVPRGEATWMVPAEVLARFAGQPRLYFTLAFAPDDDPRFVIAAASSPDHPYVSLAGLTGRSLRQIRLMPRGRGGSGDGSMAWAGDSAGIAAPPAPPTSGPAAPGYDDGFGPLPVAPAAPSVPEPSQAPAAAPAAPVAAPPAPPPPAAQAGVALSSDRTAVTAPSVNVLSGATHYAAEAALAMLPAGIGTLVNILRTAATASAGSSMPVAIGVGPAAGGGLGAGGTLGAGLVFGPGGEIGVYGAAQFNVGFIASLSLTCQITITRGGIASFNGWSFGAVVSTPLGTGTALFDDAANFVGVSLEAGIDVGISPVEFYLAVQRGVATQLGMAAALGRRTAPAALTLSAERSSVPAPSLNQITGVAKYAAEAALLAVPPPLGTLITALRAAARVSAAAGTPVSIGFGPAVGGGLGAGASFGTGLVFGPGGELGVYGAAQFNVGFILSISLTCQISVVRGGIENFNGWSMAAVVSGGEGVVGGASALFDTAGNFQGVSVEAGIGAGFSPVDFYIAIQRQVATNLGMAAALGTIRGRRSAPAQAFSGEIPLDPGVGGMSIGYDALQVGDIILSTTDATISRAIRSATSGTISHAMLYVDQGGQVIEAVGDGVRMLPLSQAIADATAAVAFRVPALNATSRQRVAEEAALLLDLPYNYVGIARQAAFQVDRRLCDALPNGLADRCRHFAGRIDLGTADNNSFFCSQLVLEAYARAGHTLTTTPPHWASPEDLADLRFDYGKLRYVGHLKAAPSGGLFGHLFAHAASLNAPTGLAVVQPEYVPSDPAAAAAAIAAFNARRQAWHVGVADTSFMPHSAICHITFDNGDGTMAVGTGFYIAPGLIATAGHVLHGKTGTGTVHVGRNGRTSALATFNIAPADWAVHPQYVDGGSGDFDIAVIRTSTRPPGGNWFELEALDMSTNDTIVVCGYAVGAADLYKQHMDGDWIRGLSDNMHVGYYNLQTTGGTSGSPAFYVGAYEDHERQQSVMDWRAIAVHISSHSSTRNACCRLTPAKIDWLLAGGQMTPALGAAAEPAPAMIGETPKLPAAAPARRRIETSINTVAYDLEQLDGMRSPESPPALAMDPVPAEVLVEDWPILGEGDAQAKAGIAVRWHHAAGALGNITLSPTTAHSGDGWQLAVRGRIADGPDSAVKAAATVEIVWQFTRGSEQRRATATLIIRGDGSFERSNTWADAPAEAVL
jgi:V8-like Glu-specific endopeptidase